MVSDQMISGTLMRLAYDGRYYGRNGCHRFRKARKTKISAAGNREWITVIQAINAEGQSIAPFIIGAGQYHLANWYRECDLPGDWVIATSQNGWTNNELGLEWLKHFDRSTTKRSNARYRLLILDGHESHHSADFERYCKENKIITLCMPAHASHLLQPLDVGCFGPLKQAYGRE
ncbi:pogo transposable element with krab domain [Fusarium oxysporum f. sp. phaseoli]